MTRGRCKGARKGQAEHRRCPGSHPAQRLTGFVYVRHRAITRSPRTWMSLEKNSRRGVLLTANLRVPKQAGAAESHQPQNGPGDGPREVGVGAGLATGRDT